MTIKQMTEDFVTKLEARMEERACELVKEAFAGIGRAKQPAELFLEDANGEPFGAQYKPKRGYTMTAKAASARVLQGRYMGGLRAAKKGVAAAVAAMAKGRS